jgi:hypothetical protein
MRTSFELKFNATDYESAVEAATSHISRFLGIAPQEVAEKLDTELKVELNEGRYEVTAYSKIKTNFVSFGLDRRK